MRFIDYCHLNRILLAVFPPHSTHRLQPLDVSLFAPLATFYSQELNQFTIDLEGLTRLTKRDFFRLFWIAFGKAFVQSNIESGWKKTGLHPFQPGAVLEKFLPKEASLDERTSSSESSKSVLTANDWRKIEQKLKAVVTDVLDVRVGELTKTIKNLAATNILLEERIKGYQRALQNEQKKRQRQKPLFQQLPTQNNGGAIFYSSKKIQQASELRKQQEDAISQEVALKADRRLQKQHLIQQRKQQHIQKKTFKKRQRQQLESVLSRRPRRLKKLISRFKKTLYRQDKKGKNSIILTQMEAVSEDIVNRKSVEVDLTSQRPQRQKRMPK
jgi:hypothetical protein